MKDDIWIDVETPPDEPVFAAVLLEVVNRRRHLSRGLVSRTPLGRWVFGESNHERATAMEKARVISNQEIPDELLGNESDGLTTFAWHVSSDSWD